MHPRNMVRAAFAAIGAFLALSGFQATVSNGQGAVPADPKAGTVTTQPISLVAASTFADSTVSNQMRDWLAALRQNEPRRAPSCRWRMLALIYPNLDTDYKDAQGRISHHTAKADPALVRTVLANISELSGLVRQISGGACELQVDAHVIERNVTLARNGKGAGGSGFPAPDDEDTKPEIDRFNKPVVYDSIAIMFNPGDLPQSLAGAGGGGRNGTHFVGNLGDLGRWKKDPGFVGGSMSWGQGLIIHEWTHGLEGFYGGSGYLLKELHHLYRYGKMGLDDKDLYIAYHQGILSYLNGGRFGYTRSVWLSGSPRHPIDLLPCQLTSPIPGATLSADRVELQWAKTAAPGGYLVTVTPQEGENVSPIELRTSDNWITVPKDRLKPGGYRWHVQALKGERRSEVGDTLSFTIAEPAQLISPTVKSVALDRATVPGNGGMVRFWARLSSTAGIRTAYLQYDQIDGTHERVRLQRRSGWSADNRWSGLLWVTPNRTGMAGNLALRLHIEDNAGKTFDSDPIALAVAAPTTPSKASFSASQVADQIEAIGDGVVPGNSADTTVPRFTWWNHRGTVEWVEVDYDEPQAVDACDVYWFHDSPRSGCKTPAAWRLLYRDDKNLPWKEVQTKGPYTTDLDRWNALRFAPIKARQFRIEARLRPGFSGGILEWQLLNLNVNALRPAAEAVAIKGPPAEFLVVPQNWRGESGRAYAPFPDFDFLQVRVNLPKGSVGETNAYDGKTWADIRWPDGRVQHVACEQANMSDGSEEGRLPYQTDFLYGVAGAWVPRQEPALMDYEVQYHYRHPDGSVSDSRVERRVFVPDLARVPAVKPAVSASWQTKSDPIEAMMDGLLPRNSRDFGVPRFTWWDHKGGKEWIQVDYPTLQTLDSSYVYWFQDTPSGGCKVPESWRLLYREDATSPWREVQPKEPYTTAIDEWNVLRFAPVKARQFRIEAKLKPGFSGGILEWRLF